MNTINSTRFFSDTIFLKAVIPLLMVFSVIFAGYSFSYAQTEKDLRARTYFQFSIRSVKEIQNSYSYFLSAGDWDNLAALFTEDAEFISGANSKPKIGQSEIKQHFMNEASRDSIGLAEGQLFEHLILQPIINVSDTGDEIFGTWHELALLGEFKKYALWKGGVYEATYMEINGSWKISKLIYSNQYYGSYDDDGHVAPPAWNIPYHFSSENVGLTIPDSVVENFSKHFEFNESALIQYMEDETALTNLQHSLGYYLDRKLWDDVVDLFSAEWSLNYSDFKINTKSKSIRQGLEELFGSYGLDNGEMFDHTLTSTITIINKSRDEAVVKSKVVSQLGRNGEFARWELGEFENIYVLDNGVWKLKNLVYLPRMSTDYDIGWSSSALNSYSLSGNESVIEKMYPHNYGFNLNGLKQELSIKRDLSGFSQAIESGKLSLDQLQRKLHNSIAIDAVENLNSSYGYYIDESAWDSMADTFSQNGSKEITGVGVYVGPERIRTILNLRGPKGGRRPNFFTIHQLLQPVIHVSDDGKTANARLRLFQSGGSADGSSGSWIGGIYENTADFENGQWKFGRQDLHHLFYVSYRNGWARVGKSEAVSKSGNNNRTRRDIKGGGMTQGLGGAASPNSFAQDYPPDREIRAKQYSFPEISELAFHYKNPVTGRMPSELLINQ